ncbi:uncharacterized protein I206_100559 [Kwoniella pini CBS 10737]|uniref:BZIP domain-containing protein n=1 Tax=Kwoniella pini CBS 10737 TaxID=1296096 RepID=A0AAJ8KZZ6_9TREE
MSRLDSYHSMLDTNVNVDVDAEFDNPTILDHSDDDNQNQDQKDLEMGVGIMDDEHDESPFVIMEEDQNQNHIENQQSNNNQENVNVNLENNGLIELSNNETRIDPQLESQDVIHNRPPTHEDRLQAHRATRGSSGGMSLKGMSAADKKQRQKLQNKQAAERSRNKRKAEQLALEKQVEDMQTENVQLRLRVQTLLSSKSLPSPNEPLTSSDQPGNETIEDSIPSSAVPSDPITIELIGTGIDYNYINKLTNELYNTKKALMERKLNLEKLKNNIPLSPSPPPQIKIKENKDKDNNNIKIQEENLEENINPKIKELKENRNQYLKIFSKLKSTKAEQSSLNTLLNHLKSEVENLRKQAQMVKEKLNEKRNAIQNPPINQNENISIDISQELNTVHSETENIHSETDTDVVMAEQNQDQDQNQGENQDNPTVDDIRGWIDAAVKGWDQSMPLQQSSDQSKDNEAESREDQHSAVLEKIAQINQE